VFRPLLEPSRYKGAHGGRGSGKSWFFAELIVEECLRQPGTLAVCIREVQKTLAQSSKRLIETKIEQLGVGSGVQRFAGEHRRTIDLVADPPVRGVNCIERQRCSVGELRVGHELACLV